MKYPNQPLQRVTASLVWASPIGATLEKLASIQEKLSDAFPETVHFMGGEGGLAGFNIVVGPEPGLVLRRRSENWISENSMQTTPLAATAAWKSLNDNSIAEHYVGFESLHKWLSICWHELDKPNAKIVNLSYLSRLPGHWSQYVANLGLSADAVASTIELNWARQVQDIEYRVQVGSWPGDPSSSLLATSGGCMLTEDDSPLDALRSRVHDRMQDIFESLIDIQKVEEWRK